MLTNLNFLFDVFSLVLWSSLESADKRPTIRVRTVDEYDLQHIYRVVSLYFILRARQTMSNYSILSDTDVPLSNWNILVTRPKLRLDVNMAERYEETIRECSIKQIHAVIIIVVNNRGPGDIYFVFFNFNDFLIGILFLL